MNCPFKVDTLEYLSFLCYDVWRKRTGYIFGSKYSKNSGHRISDTAGISLRRVLKLFTQLCLFAEELNPIIKVSYHKLANYWSKKFIIFCKYEMNEYRNMSNFEITSLSQMRPYRFRISKYVMDVTGHTNICSTKLT